MLMGVSIAGLGVVPGCVPCFGVVMGGVPSLLIEMGVSTAGLGVVSDCAPPCGVVAGGSPQTQIQGGVGVVCGAGVVFLLSKCGTVVEPVVTNWEGVVIGFGVVFVVNLTGMLPISVAEGEVPNGAGVVPIAPGVVPIAAGVVPTEPGVVDLGSKYGRYPVGFAVVAVDFVNR